MKTLATASQPLGVNRWVGVMSDIEAEDASAHWQIRAVPDAGTGIAASADIAIEDWDILFGAIKARLRHLALDTPGSVMQMHAQDASTHLQGSMLECVSALDQLHTTLKHELSRCHPDDPNDQQSGNGLAWVWAASSCCASEVNTTSHD